MRRSWRLLVFVLVCLLGAGGSAGYLLHAAARARSAAEAAPPVAQLGAGDAARLAGEPRVLFRSTALGATYGRLGMVPLDDPAGPRALADLRCLRVYFAAGRGLCLASEGKALPTYTAYLLDASLEPVRELATSGLPSRARLSPGGRYAATTVFVSGHSYAANAFSTETVIWEAASGKRVANLEELTVLRDGRRFRRVDFNFWGVTFARDERRFYATLGTGGKTYLVEGDLAERTMRVLRDNVECPSLSPDGTRLAYKQRVDGTPVTWRLHVLDLTTMRAHPLAETRSVDDQVEWLDNGHVLYVRRSPAGTASTNVLVVPADGSGAPRVFLPDAYSPSVIRD